MSNISLEKRPVAAYIIGAAVLVALILIIWSGRSGKNPGGYENGELSALANCLKESGALFYGTFWCPHCDAQKDLFGSAAKELPYIECSTADGRGQLPVCAEAQIAGYPTWVFADGSRLSGQLPLEVLASQTGCAMPQS